MTDTETRPVVQKNGGILVGPDDYLQPTDHSPTDPDATYLDLTENLKALSGKLPQLVFQTCCFELYDSDACNSLLVFQQSVTYLIFATFWRMALRFAQFA